MIGKVRCVNATWQVGKVVGSHVFNSFSVEGENSGWLCLLTFKRLEATNEIALFLEQAMKAPTVVEALEVVAGFEFGNGPLGCWMPICE